MPASGMITSSLAGTPARTPACVAVRTSACTSSATQRPAAMRPTCCRCRHRHEAVRSAAHASMGGEHQLIASEARETHGGHISSRRHALILAWQPLAPRAAAARCCRLLAPPAGSCSRRCSHSRRRRRCRSSCLLGCARRRLPRPRAGQHNANARVRWRGRVADGLGLEQRALDKRALVRRQQPRAGRQRTLQLGEPRLHKRIEHEPGINLCTAVAAVTT